MKLSIGIVARNEEGFLESLLNDMKAQTYPHENIEILLIDSMSTDRTLEIMQQFQKENKDFYSVKVLKNTKMIQAAGWNVAIQNFSGDALARIDAHTKIPPQYAEIVIRLLESGENIVGGKRPCIMENDTLWGRTLLIVENSLFGCSINSSKRSEEKKYVKTMFHAAYRRQVFDAVGLFNEHLLRTEDNEMHYRMRQAGFRFCYDPEIVTYQYSRNSLRKMIKQKYGNGYWIGKTVKYCPGCLSFYHFVPLAFVLAIILTTLFAVMWSKTFSVLLWAMYGFFAVLNTIFSVFENRKAAFFPIMPFLFLILHISYGIGTLVGLLNPIKFKENT